ncbi:dipeptidylpeptidase [Coemansia erecta]|uniref:Dipeptidyl-peptidase V n=1 Tax=Coemansia asiatica TaxID=1052880 RepID=A0A9W7XEH4_9FUNG|nr:dipeptidylpeptidase [Coemansia asiatica]KAJ2855726.1 dipeptidylpeptidase [Coemansia erecta]
MRWCRLYQCLLISAVVMLRLQSVVSESALNKNTKPLDIRTYYSLHYVSQPLVSPDQTRILYTEYHYDQDQNDEAAMVNMVDIASGTTKTLTPNTVGQNYEAIDWLDDNFIAYAYNGSIYSMPAQEGANGSLVFEPPWPIGTTKLRDKIITFGANVYPSCNLQQTSDRRAEEKSNQTTTAMVFDNLWVRHWDSWMTMRKPNVFSASLVRDDDRWSVGTERNLLAELPTFHDPLIRWYADDYSLDQQGKMAAFVARNPSDNMAAKTNVDIYLVPVDGSKKPKLLTGDFEGVASSPVFSPDGKYLAWLQMETPGYESDINRIFIFDIEAETNRSIARDWDRSPDSLLWSADSNSLFLLAPEHGNTLIFAIDVSSGSRQKLTESGTAIDIALVGQDQLALQYTDQDRPTDLYLLDIGTKKMRQLTDVNAERLKDAYVGAAEEFWFNGARDEKVHGWLVKPPAFDPAKKYPLVYIIHGGPQESFLKTFGFSASDLNLYASAGFIAAVVNFHGSTGYGQNFTDSINGQWGGYPYEDLMKGLDSILEKHKYVDPGRLVAIGGSYGGYMVNWINGHTRRFKALVAYDGEFSTILGWYGSDELWLAEHDMGGTPYDAGSRRTYEKYNPERFARDFSTPTLFFHGGNDFRLGFENSLAPFTLLRRKGIPARLVYFPDEGHLITHKGNEIKYLIETFRWIAEHTKTEIPYDYTV